MRYAIDGILSGPTVAAPIKQSLIGVHVWPELEGGYMWLTIDSCKSFDVETVIHVIDKFFRPEKVQLLFNFKA